MRNVTMQHAQDEERSFAPVPEELRVAETKPIPTRNTSLAAVAKGVNNLHACHEITQGKVGTIETDVGVMKTDMAHLKGVVDGIAIGMGLPSSAQLAAGATPSQSAKSIARWDIKTIAAVVGATGGGLILFKIVAAVAPVAWQALLSVN